jgi:hypothetical protein
MQHRAGPRDDRDDDTGRRDESRHRFPSAHGRG